MSLGVPPAGSSQTQIIRWIDEQTERQVAESVELECRSPSRISLILRLLFIPPLKLALSLILKRNILRGVSGIKQAGADWAFAFVYAAKRYEHYYADDTALKERYRDFLQP